MALADFCPRCFWVKLHSRGQLPIQIFPGIFSSIDAYTKRVVQAWFDEFGGPPPWLKGLDGVTGYKEPPSYHMFNTVNDEFGIYLTGSPDAVFLRTDGSYLIADYKTAKYTGAQDNLLPIYKGQLNAYAYIGERTGLRPVTRLALIYMEPVTDGMAAGQAQNRRADGFAMRFTARILPVNLDATMLRPLFQKTREMWELSSPPPVSPSCKDCQKLCTLIKRLS